METPSKRFFPVINCVFPYQRQGIEYVIMNAYTAFRNGADGIFLAGSRVGMDYGALLHLYERVREEYPGRWIGVNFSDITADKDWWVLANIIRTHSCIDAIWVEETLDVPLDMNFKIEVFGSLSFKNSERVLRGGELVDACDSALEYVDVITADDRVANSLPDPTQLEEMRGIVGPEMRLALAGGITTSDVDIFSSAVDTFVATSGISEKVSRLRNQEYLTPRKIAALAEAIHRCSRV